MGLFWVCLGGALGSGARYLTSLGAARLLGSEFPYGTATVNVAGSFLLALLMGASADSQISPELRLALGTGATGGFTTYSAFNLETLRLIERSAWTLAFAYVGLTVLACLLAGALGILVGRTFR